MASYLFDKLNYPGFKNIPGAVYTRSGVEYQQNASGVLVPFDENVPPISAGVGVDVWEARTNTLLWSGDQTNAWWTKAGLSAAAGPLGPDGQTSGTTLTVNSDSAVVKCVYDGSGGVAYTPGAAYTSSWIVKQGSGVRYVQVALYNSAFAASRYANFDLQLGTVALTSASSSASITPLAGGWFLIAVTATAATSIVGPGGYLFIVDSGTAIFTEPSSAASGSTLHTWGAQMEAGAAVSPYIQTTSAAATRGNPTMYINAPGLLVPPFTVQVWAQLPSIDGADRALVQLDDGSNTNRIQLLRNSSNQAAIQASGGTGGIPAVFTGKTGSRLLKMALRVRTTDYALACDGAGPNSVSGITLPPNMSVIRCGNNSGTAAPLNGTITRLKIINSDISDTELVSLTV